MGNGNIVMTRRQSLLGIMESFLYIMEFFHHFYMGKVSTPFG